MLSGLIMLLLAIAGYEVLYARAVEMKAAQRLHLEECLDAAEYAYNSTGILLYEFTGCQFQWTPTQVRVRYQDVERYFPYDQVYGFSVQARTTLSVDKDSFIDGNVWARKAYLYGDSKLLFNSPYKGVQTIWKNQIKGYLLMEYPIRNIVMIGWKSWKTTYEQSWYYYPGLATTWDDRTNLIFQGTATCYYTYLPNCSGAKVRIVNLDDGMGAVLPKIAPWQQPHAGGAPDFESNLFCSAGQLWVEGTPHPLQTATLSLVYQDMLTVLNGTEAIVLPSANTALSGCRLSVGSGFYAGLSFSASGIEVRNAALMGANLIAPTIDVTNSQLQGVKMTASAINVYSSDVTGYLTGDIVRLIGSRVCDPSYDGQPAVIIRIIH